MTHDLKFCRDCRYYKKDRIMGHSYDNCLRPKPSEDTARPIYYLITGDILNKEPRFIYCIHERAHQKDSHCGPDGIFWEPRKPSLFKKFFYAAWDKWIKKEKK